MLCLVSFGWAYLRAWQLALLVARQARCFAEGELLLVPGHRLRADDLPPAYQRRLRRACRLWRSDRRLLISGAAAAAEEQSEALAGYAFLRDLGLPVAAAVELDQTARDTRDNLVEARRRLRTDETLVVISNRWHLARCALLARQIGIEAKLCAAERYWQNDSASRLALCREAFALLCFCGLDAVRTPARSLLENAR